MRGGRSLQGLGAEREGRMDPPEDSDPPTLTI